MEVNLNSLNHFVDLNPERSVKSVNNPARYPLDHSTGNAVIISVIYRCTGSIWTFMMLVRPTMKLRGSKSCFVRKQQKKNTSNAIKNTANTISSTSKTTRNKLKTMKNT